MPFISEFVPVAFLDVTWPTWGFWNIPGPISWPDADTMHFFSIRLPCLDYYKKKEVFSLSVRLSVKSSFHFLLMEYVHNISSHEYLNNLFFFGHFWRFNYNGEQNKCDLPRRYSWEPMFVGLRAWEIVISTGTCGPLLSALKSPFDRIPEEKDMNKGDWVGNMSIPGFLILLYQWKS